MLLVISSNKRKWNKKIIGNLVRHNISLVRAELGKKISNCLVRAEPHLPIVNFHTLLFPLY
jgi:hypothetical protein